MYKHICTYIHTYIYICIYIERLYLCVRTRAMLCCWRGDTARAASCCALSATAILLCRGRTPFTNLNTLSRVSFQVRTSARSLACTRYCFTSKLYCGSQSSVYCPSPTCKAYPIAILLHDHCAMYAPPLTPPFYVIHHTILVIPISCKGQPAGLCRSQTCTPKP